MEGDQYERAPPRGQAETRACSPSVTVPLRPASEGLQSAAPAARRALRHCEQIQAIENAPKPFKVKVHGKLPVCLEAGALTMVPVICPQLESAEFLLEPLGFDGEQLPEGVQPGQSGVPGFAQEGEIPIDSPARDDPPAGNDDETRDAVIWYEAEHEPQEPQPAPTCPSVAEEIDMEDMAEMPEETTAAQQYLEVWVAAQVVVECSPTVTLSVRVTSLGLRSAIPMGEGTRRYRQSECRLLFS
ncbi:unnamed protein product [Arctogadus glacialis]